MIIDKTIFVKSSKFYERLGYNIKDRYIEIKIKDLPLGSHSIINAKCYYCNYERTISYKEYNRNISYNGYFSCSNKCSSIKRKETMLNRYCVEHYSKTDEYKERFKKTNLDKYGVEHAMMSNTIKKKLEKSILDKYGVENVFKSEIIKNKIKLTNLNKYGVENPMYSDFFKNKIKKTNFKNYYVDNYMKSENHHSNTIIGNDINYIKYLGNNISLFNCFFGHKFEINEYNYHGRTKGNIPLCTICYPIGDQKSIKEKELLEYIKSIYSGDIISSYRDQLEIDIYLPELKLGFEFNGLYFHSNKFKDKNYHLDKTNYFKDKGIRIIHIWEDDYDYRLEIIKSQIKNILKINNTKIYARKCIVKEVSIKDCKKFLNENHIQGSVSSQIKIGLYYNEDELVSIMTFNGFEGRKKMELGGYNLNRFCNLLNTNVIGGASKLLSHFINNYDVKRIVSYADKDWSIGNLYEVLGFINVGGNGPDYKYIVDNQRVHKSRYKKSKLKTELTEAKQMEKDGFLKIYDCGKIKFEYIKNLVYLCI